MIEQVLGGGGGGGGVVLGGCTAIFGSVFQSYYIFVSVFFNSPMPFFGSILPIFEYVLLYIMCISSKTQTVCFGHKIVVIFKISSLAPILQFLEGIVGNKMPNEWILLQQYFYKMFMRKDC